MRFIRTFLAAAIALGAAIPAFALTGTPPGTGPQLIDGQWLNGLAGGLNNLYLYGLTATGSGQSTAVQIPSGYYLVEFDTVASSTGAYLPFCTPGTDMLIYNNGAQTLTIYPNPGNNPLTITATTTPQDTINNTTSTTITSHSSASMSCAKAGVWFGK